MFPQLDHCGRFVVPTPPEKHWEFLYAARRPNIGIGVIVPAGTEYLNATTATITETLYYYAEVNGVFCRDEQFYFLYTSSTIGR